LGKGKKEEVCSVKCRIKAEQEKFNNLDENQQEAEETLIESFKETYNKIITEIKNNFAPFYEIIKEVRANELKENFLRRKMYPYEFCSNYFSTIDKDSSLKTAEKEE